MDKKWTKKYETGVCKALDVRQFRTVIPKREETNQAIPVTASASCLQRFSGHSTGRWNWSGVRKTLWVGRLRKATQLEGLEHRTGEDRAAQTELQQSAEGPLWLFSWVWICALMWETYPMLEKSLPKNIRGNSAWNPLLVRNNVCSLWSCWKTQNSCCLVYNTQRNLPPQWEEIRPRLTTVLIMHRF